MATIETADVVVVGSGIAGAPLAYKLAQAGVSVLMLEAGPRIQRADALGTFFRNPHKGPNGPYPSQPYAPHPDDADPASHYVNTGPDKFRGSYVRGVGGTSWHWTGFAIRLRPSDLTLHSTYGVGEDWPIRYQELESWYQAAEREWGVSGDPEQSWGAPRKEPYPMPLVPATYLDQVISKAIKPLSLSTGLFAHARNSVPFDDRPACCGSNTCVPICPIGAKYDGSVHVHKAEQAGVRLLDQALVNRVVVGSDNRIEQVVFRRSDGSEGSARGKIFVLACHAIETPKLLLMSRNERFPSGVANSSDQVGRNLLSQVDVNTWGMAKEPVFPYRGPQQTSGILELRDGPHRREFGAVGTSLMNNGWSGNVGPLHFAEKLARTGLRGKALAERVDYEVSRHVRLNSSVEILADPDNRIVLDFDNLDSAGTPKPKVFFKIDDYTKAGLKQATARDRQIMAALGATQVASDEPSASTAIICGTCKMGTDPKHSVVSPELRSHDHSNLFICGTATHITAPINAPSLTVTAMALRAAEQIKADLQA